MDHVEERLKELAPDVAVVDSIQTMYRPEMASGPGKRQPGTGMHQPAHAPVPRKAAPPCFWWDT